MMLPLAGPALLVQAIRMYLTDCLSHQVTCVMEEEGLRQRLPAKVVPQHLLSLAAHGHNERSAHP